MADLTDSAAVLESIKAGEHDEILVDLIEAFRLRLTFGEKRLKWKMSYRIDDDTFEVREDDLTLGEARLVERACLTSWGEMNPVKSGTECLAITAVCLHTRHGKSLKFTREGPSGEAWDLASNVTATEAAESIETYQVDDAPKD